jgi:Cd2+/Zn2+-exporting ATPase
MKTVAFKIYGMDCAEEVTALKAEITPLSGVHSLSFDVLNGKMIVEFSKPELGSDAVMSAVARTGMRAEPWENLSVHRDAISSWARWGRTIMTTSSGFFLLAGFFAQVRTSGWYSAIVGEGVLPLGAKLLYVASAITGAWFVAPRAWRALIRLRPDMNLLFLSLLNLGV